MRLACRSAEFERVNIMNIRRSLVVNSTPMETRIALLENGQPCELFIERTTHVSHVGDVYKGRVAKLLTGMQSAFVTVGGPKDGFLYLDEPEAHRIGVEEVAELDEDLLKHFVGTVSLPFEAGANATVAIKIVDDRGIESLKVMKLVAASAAV